MQTPASKQRAPKSRPPRLHALHGLCRLCDPTTQLQSFKKWWLSPKILLRQITEEGVQAFESLAGQRSVQGPEVPLLAFNLCNCLMSASKQRKHRWAVQGTGGLTRRKGVKEQLRIKQKNKEPNKNK